MKNFFRGSTWWLLVIIIIIGAILRFAYLDRIPSGISDDENDYVLTAKSVFYTGKNLDGTFKPFSLQSPPEGAFIPSARAPYMLLSPLIGMFDSGLAFSKIPYGVISVLTIVVLYLITLRLLGKRIALYTAFVLSVNPWSIYFGRTAFEAPMSIFFVYVSLLCLLYLSKWWLLLSIIPWIIGFFSYQGINIIYLPILILGVIGTWKLRNGLYTGQYTALLIMGTVLFTLFVLAIHNNDGSRLGEISVPDSAWIISKVNDDRRTSVQAPFNPFFVNKYTVYLRDGVGKYINAFSGTHLFVSGESRSTFSLWTHGLFYPFELVLLLIGLYQLYRLNKSRTIFLLSLVALSPIPAVLSMVGSSYALRAGFMYPLYCIFIGTGIAVLFEKKQRYQIKIGITLLYVIAVAIFLHLYFIRNPVNNSEGFGFGNRVLARYVALASGNGEKVLYAGNGIVNTYRQYIFYNNLLTRDTAIDIQKSIRLRDYTFGSAHFIECPKEATDKYSEYTVIVPFGTKCNTVTDITKRTDLVVIAQLNDAGRIFEINNDKVCTKYTLSEYQPMISFNDLAVESLSVEKFCRTYISRPKTVTL